MANDIALSHVYVLEGAAGICKIGIAEDVASRINALQTGHPEKLTLHLALPMYWEFVRPVERECHKILRGDRRSGEWFTISPHIAVETVKSVAARLVPNITDDLLRASLGCIETYREAGEEWVKLQWKKDALRRQMDDLEKQESYLLFLMRVEDEKRERALAEFHSIGGAKELWGSSGVPMSNVQRQRFLLECLMNKPPQMRTREEQLLVDAEMALRRPKGDA
jgi:hypothetical protein